MNKWIKNIIGIFFALIILITVLVIGSVYMLEASLPEYNGSVSLQGLENEVSVYRDDYGVAYIHSESEIDAYFTLGYIHAQERLFQMDISRRAGQGRLSELFGSKTIFYDKMFRTIGLAEVAKLNYQQYDEEIKKVLEAYSNGINEFIRNSPEKYTIEFDLLGYKPDLWKPEHSLLLAKLMAWELNISWWSDIALTHLIQKFGMEKVQDILPTFDENGPRIVPGSIDKYSHVSMDLIKIDREFRKFMNMEGTHIGSNNWVVSGEKSVSGMPIIANDPHLSFTAPGKWYVVCINSYGLKAEGFTLPGIPGIVIGKNQDISWVLTNIMADDSDFYIEKLDTLGEKYFFNDEWYPLIIKTDTIEVKDSTSIIFNIKSNHRGPIISDIHTYNKLFPNEIQKSSVISMRWSALEYSNELQAFYGINHSSDWEQFNKALELFHSPGQNFVYADKKGNIGYVAGVKLPKRKNNSPTFLYDGTNNLNDWDGYIRFNENPRLYNPQQNYIASANNKTIENYPYHISNVWEPKSRITRIVELLNQKEKHSAEDFKLYQNDIYSHFAKELVPFIINAFENYKINDKNIKTSLDLLKHWNYYLEAESQVPTIYAVFFQKLMENIFIDELGEELFNEYIFLANIPYKVVPKLLSDNQSKWFDNVNTDVIEHRDEIIRKSLIDAITFLENNLGGEISRWQWGELHKVRFNHFFHGASSLTDNLLDIGDFVIGGDGTTVFNAEYALTKPYQNKLGPSMRFIYDFAKPDEFEFILPAGQSGHFFSDHYDDMTKLWLNGKYLKINTNIDSVRMRCQNVLKLIPER